MYEIFKLLYKYWYNIIGYAEIYNNIWINTVSNIWQKIFIFNIDDINKYWYDYVEEIEKNIINNNL